MCRNTSFGEKYSPLADGEGPGGVDAQEEQQVLAEGADATLVAWAWDAPSEICLEEGKLGPLWEDFEE